MYRDLKLRGAIVQDKQVVILPKEQIISRYSGVWNLSAEQGNLGSFYLTNVRVIWFAQFAENFNVSLPWVQVKCVKVRDSKYGKALVLETSDFSGNYILGFRVEQLEEVFTEITNLFKTYSQNPVFGVEVAFDETDGGGESAAAKKFEDTMEIIDTGYDNLSLASTAASQKGRSYAEGGSASTGAADLIFSEELGLAIEKPANGVSIE